MVQSCMGVCGRSAAPPARWGRRYVMGHRRCSVCEAFFEGGELRCPCCHTKLRTRPRAGRRAPT